MQNATGLVFPPVLVLCWPQPAQNFGGKSAFSYHGFGEKFYQHLEKCKSFSLTLLSWLYLHFMLIFSCFYLGLC